MQRFFQRSPWIIRSGPILVLVIMELLHVSQSLRFSSSNVARCLSLANSCPRSLAVGRKTSGFIAQQWKLDHKFHSHRLTSRNRSLLYLLPTSNQLTSMEKQFESVLQARRGMKRKFSNDSKKVSETTELSDIQIPESFSDKIDSSLNNPNVSDAKGISDENFNPFNKIFDPDIVDWDARKFAFKRIWRRRFGAVFSAIGFISSSTKALVNDVTQVERMWLPAYEAFVQFLQTTGINLELQSLVNRRLLDNIIILGMVQNEALAVPDRRDAALSDLKQHTNLPTKEEGLRYMKFATAAYGESMIRSAEIGRMGRFNTSSLTLLPVDDATSEARLRSRICSHCDISSDTDLIFADVDFGGDVSVLRHFIALDHDKKEIILSIRGTFSLAELVVDIAAFSRPFCGGEAHSEMAGMAERLWQISGPTILDLLEKHPDYELVLVGHSLGAGTSALLNILCHASNRKLVRGRRVRCYTFACPPVFAPLDQVPDAFLSCTNFIHENDCVPFLSVDSVRHLFNCIRAIEEKDMRLINRLRIITSYTKPDEQLIALVQRAHEKRLDPLPGAPVLTIPASRNFWLKEHLTNTSVAYDIKVCDSIKLAKLGLYIHPNMVDDHLPSVYEQALQHLD